MSRIKMVMLFIAFYALTIFVYLSDYDNKIVSKYNNYRKISYIKKIDRESDVCLIATISNLVNIKLDEDINYCDNR